MKLHFPSFSNSGSCSHLPSHQQLHLSLWPQIFTLPLLPSSLKTISKPSAALIASTFKLNENPALPCPSAATILTQATKISHLDHALAAQQVSWLYLSPLLLTQHLNNPFPMEVKSHLISAQKLSVASRLIQSKIQSRYHRISAPGGSPFLWCHSCLLPVPQTQHAHSCLRAFALTVPLLECCSSDVPVAHSLICIMSQVLLHYWGFL